MFDQNMLNELAKLKVDRKRKKVESEEIEYQVQEEDNFQDEMDDSEESEILEDIDIDNVEDRSSLTNLSNFIGDTISKKDVDPNKFIKETDTDNSDDEFDNEDAEKKSIIISGRKSVKNYLDKDGNDVPSKYMDENGNVNVVYGVPGKNIVNRKSIEDQRLDVKMDALSGLLSKFKTEDEISKEENDPDVIMMDKIVTVKKDLKRMDDLMSIQDNFDIKISMVDKAFEKISKVVEEKANLPKINLNVISLDYLRALFTKKSLDDMDVARIFLLSLFLEDPEKFPTDDTFEQIEYRNSQVGAKCKSIDLKRMITYISSDSEFNSTVELVNNIVKKEHFDVSGVVDVFNFKCREALKTLMVNYLKKDSMDPMNRVNVISIRKDMQFRYRNVDSTISFIHSLKTKLKAIHPSLKEQLRKTNEQIAETEEKLHEVKQTIIRSEVELTVLIILNIARLANGYNLAFSLTLPKEEIVKQLQEYNVNLDSNLVKEIIENGIKEEMINNILKTR